jgi:thiamine-monophosphate kinase
MTGGHTALGPGGEFDAVRAWLVRWGSTAHGIGDDAAILDVPHGSRLLASTDTSVEDVHFRRGWLTAEEIGWRATTAALSDLAAMGADALGVLVGIVVPPRWRDDLAGLGDGIAAAARAAGAPIVGGDTTGGELLTLAITVLGTARSPLTRAGARAGDTVYVTGRLGGPRATLRAWALGGVPAPEWRARFAHPAARLAEGRWLADHGARAAIDISDGLAADLRHVAAASGVHIALDVAAVPALAGVDDEDALAGGEEYELAVTGPALDVAAFERAFGVPLTAIGSVRAGPPAVTGARSGTVVDLPEGHDHFSRR